MQTKRDLLSSLPSCQAVLIGNGEAKSGFLREGSHRVTACEVVVVDDKVMAVINTDGTGAVGVIERAKGILDILNHSLFHFIRRHI